MCYFIILNFHNSNYLTETNLCKNLFSLQIICSFCKPCYGLTKIELLAKFVMGLLRWSFL